MHQHVVDGGFGPLDSGLDRPGDGVPLPHADGIVHHHVQVDKELEAHLAHEAFLRGHHAGHGFGQGAEVLRPRAGRGFVHDFAESRPENMVGIVHDKTTGHQRRPIVGAFPTPAANQGNADAHKRGGRGDGVGAVVPGVGLHGAAVHLVAHAQHPAVERFLDGNDDGQHGQRKLSRQRVRGLDAHQALVSNVDRGRHQGARHQQGRQGLGLAVAVGVIVVGLAGGGAQPQPHDAGTHDVGGRLNGVGNQGVGIAQHAGRALAQHQGHVGPDAQQRGGLPARGPLGVGKGDILFDGHMAA